MRDAPRPVEGDIFRIEPAEDRPTFAAIFERAEPILRQLEQGHRQLPRAWNAASMDDRAHVARILLDSEPPYPVDALVQFLRTKPKGKDRFDRFSKLTAQMYGLDARLIAEFRCSENPQCGKILGRSHGYRNRENGHLTCDLYYETVMTGRPQIGAVVATFIREADGSVTPMFRSTQVEGNFIVNAGVSAVCKVHGELSLSLATIFTASFVGPRDKPVTFLVDKSGTRLRDEDLRQRAEKLPVTQIGKRPN